MITGPSQSKPGVPIASGGGSGVEGTDAVLVGLSTGDPGVTVKWVSSEEGIGVESGGGVGVAGFNGVATGAAHEIKTLANSVMIPKLTGRFMVLLLSSR